MECSYSIPGVALTVTLGERRSTFVFSGHISVHTVDSMRYKVTANFENSCILVGSPDDGNILAGISLTTGRVYDDIGACVVDK